MNAYNLESSQSSKFSSNGKGWVIEIIIKFYYKL